VQKRQKNLTKFQNFFDIWIYQQVKGIDFSLHCVFNSDFKFLTIKNRLMISVYDLPLLNSVLNSISTLLLLGGFVAIKKGNREVHMRFMWSALTVSTLFLTSYLIFHYQVGSVGFTGEGWIRPVYFTILISHIILAIVIVPLILKTFFHAVKRDFNKHKKIARITWPIWMYVSVTGVMIYLFMALTNSYDVLL